MKEILSIEEEGYVENIIGHNICKQIGFEFETKLLAVEKIRHEDNLPSNSKEHKQFSEVDEVFQVDQILFELFKIHLIQHEMDEIGKKNLIAKNFLHKVPA